MPKLAPISLVLPQSMSSKKIYTNSNIKSQKLKMNKKEKKFKTYLP
jgi:hypothetical protein